MVPVLELKLKQLSGGAAAWAMLVCKIKGLIVLSSRTIATTKFVYPYLSERTRMRFIFIFIGCLSRIIEITYALLYITITVIPIKS